MAPLCCKNEGKLALILAILTLLSGSVAEEQPSWFTQPAPRQRERRHRRRWRRRRWRPHRGQTLESRTSGRRRLGRRRNQRVSCQIIAQEGEKANLTWLLEKTCFHRSLLLNDWKSFRLVQDYKVPLFKISHNDITTPDRKIQPGNLSWLAKEISRLVFVPPGFEPSSSILFRLSNSVTVVFRRLEGWIKRLSINYFVVLIEQIRRFWLSI